MSKEKEGKFENLNPNDRITVKKISEGFKKAGHSTVEMTNCQSYGWNMAMDYKGLDDETIFYCIHEPGFMILITPLRPRIQAQLDNGEKIKKIVDETIGYLPCGCCEMPWENIGEKVQAYIYSDGLTDEECFKEFKESQEKGNKDIMNLKRLNSERPVLN